MRGAPDLRKGPLLVLLLQKAFSLGLFVPHTTLLTALFCSSLRQKAPLPGFFATHASFFNTPFIGSLFPLSGVDRGKKSQRRTYRKRHGEKT